MIPSHKPRRTTQKRRRGQRGGAATDALEAWLSQAAELHDTSPSPEQPLAALRKPELSLTPQKGPEIPTFSPPFLSDIMVSVAAGFGDIPLQTGTAFTVAVQKQKETDKEFYMLLTTLEGLMRQAFMSLVRRESTPPIDPASAAIDLVSGPMEKTPFVWIAFANLPPVPVDPIAPTLIPDAFLVAAPAPAAAGTATTTLPAPPEQ